MEYGICNLTIVPLRADEAHRSEMVSQVLFGEAFEIQMKSKEWTKVCMIADGYTGWIQNGQFLTLNEMQYQDYLSLDKEYVGFEGGFLTNGEFRIELLHGTVIRKDFAYLNDRRLKQFVVPHAPIDQTSFQLEVSLLAKRYWEVPYLWGGRSKFGIDCSGFAQLIYQSFGHALPRDAYQQAELGHTVDFLSEIENGDLAFFDNEQGRINHVGILLDSETIIHASGRVRIDSMDQEGIFNKELNKYTHKLRIIKRYI